MACADCWGTPPVPGARRQLDDPHPPHPNPHSMNNPSQTFGPVTVHFGDKNGKYPDGNQVVVQGKDTRAVFDTPLRSVQHPAPLEGADLLLLGHAHEDHCAAMHLVPGAAVFAPKGDLAAVRSVEGMLAHYGYSPAATEKMRDKISEEFHFHPRPDAVGYGDGQLWVLGGGVTVRAIHMPGHTRGHSVLMVEPGGIAFIGDIDLTGFGPYYGDACSDLRDFMATLERIEQMEARVWITYHHRGVITERETFLEMLRAFKEKVTLREAAILRVLGAGPKTLDALVAHRFMYPQGYYDVFVEDAERKTLSEHLSILMEQRRVHEEGGKYRLA